MVNSESQAKEDLTMVRISFPMRQRLKVAAAQRGMSQLDAIHAAVEKFVQASDAPPTAG